MATVLLASAERYLEDARPPVTRPGRGLARRWRHVFGGEPRGIGRVVRNREGVVTPARRLRVVWPGPRCCHDRRSEVALTGFQGGIGSAWELRGARLGKDDRRGPGRVRLHRW